MCDSLIKKGTGLFRLGGRLIENLVAAVGLEPTTYGL